MPEQVYRDLSDELSDIPPETWTGINPSGVLEMMARDVPEDVTPDFTSLRALASQVRARPVPESLRTKPWLSPRLVQLLDEQVEREVSEGLKIQTCD